MMPPVLGLPHLNLVILVCSANSNFVCVVQVIQLQGDQRKNVSTFLVQVKHLITPLEEVKD